MISIIMPTYNSAAYIAEAVKSIDFRIADLIVIDNNSTDGTIELLRKIVPSSSLTLVSSKDDGPAFAINAGLKLATSEIVGWLNSDDVYAPGAISRALSFFDKHPRAMMVYGVGRHIDGLGKSIGAYPSLPPKTSVNKFKDGSFICQPTVFLRRKVFEEVGALDENLRVAFDFDWWVRIFKRYPRSKIGFINQVQAYSRLHPGCLTRKLRMQVALEGMQVVSKHFGHAPIHWVLTYVDELCERFPFVEELEPLAKLVENFLIQMRSLIKPEDFAAIVEVFKNDWRFKLSNQNIFLSVSPDGWVSKKLVIKLRYDGSSPKLIRLFCAGDWPLEGEISLKITAPNGHIQKALLSTQEPFFINFYPDQTLVSTFAVWTIETRQSFTPSLVIKKSKDHRKLSFRVTKLEFE